MGLLPLEFTDCLTDTPHYRENLRAHEKELERTSASIKSLTKDVNNFLAAAKNMSKAQRNLASTLMNFELDCIGISQTDDEIIIAGSLKEFGRLLCVIEDERERMLERAHDSLIFPINNFRKENIYAAKEGKKKFEKETVKFCQSLERHLSISHRKDVNHLQEADASLEMEQRHFFQASLEYASLLTKIQEKKKFEFVETILSFMVGMMTFYHQGYEVANEFKPFMNDLQQRIQKIRENFCATDNEAEILKKKILEKAQDPGILNKMYTRQGYLFLMEKKALGSTWTKHFCQYQKSVKKFSLMPYSQSIGKIVNGETVTVKECVGRHSDSIDKRFCFEVTMEDKPVPLTFQALSETDKCLWLDAMDGKESSSNPSGKNSKQEGFLLDDCGFSFIQWCIYFIESKGLHDSGLYRIAGVTSKVTKFLQTALAHKGENLSTILNEEEFEIKIVTSVVKLFFKSLPEPLLTFRLYAALVTAAKQDSKQLRIKCIHSLIYNLPEANFKMLDILVNHLHKISKLSDKNLMTASNLAICLGPTLLRPEEETVASIMELKFGNVVVEILIENYEKIFKSYPEEEIRRQPPPYISPPQPSHKTSIFYHSSGQRDISIQQVPISQQAIHMVQDKYIAQMKNFSNSQQQNTKYFSDVQQSSNYLFNQNAQNVKNNQKNIQILQQSPNSMCRAEYANVVISPSNHSTSITPHAKFFNPSFSPSNPQAMHQHTFKSPTRSSSTDNFAKPLHPPNILNSALPGYTSNEQMPRIGVVYNPMWISGLPPKPSLETSIAHSVGQTRTPTSEDHRKTNAGISENVTKQQTNPKAETGTTEYKTTRGLFPSDSPAGPIMARTLFACHGENNYELSFEQNEIVHNVIPSKEPGWLRGTLRGKTGLIPENYVEFYA